MSQFRCTPEEMLERLDRFPDAGAQVREIFTHYRRVSKQREDEKILDLEKRALSGKDEAGTAHKEMMGLLSERADRNDTSPEEELGRLKARREP